MTAKPASRLGPILNQKYVERQIRNLGLALSDVPGDGHCLYHKVSRAVLANASPTAQQIVDQYSLDDQAKSVANLRMLVRDKAKHVLDAALGDIIEACTGAATAGLTTHSPPRARHPCPLDAWGTEDTVEVLAATLRLHITLYDYETGLTLSYPRGPISVNLARTGGNHYQFLQPADGQEASPGRKRQKQ